MLNNGQWTGLAQLPGLELFSEAELDSMIRILDRYMKPADRPVSAAGPAAGPKRRIGKIASDVLFYGLLLCLVGGVLLITRSGNKPAPGGYSFLNVITGSMQSVYPVGSLVVIREADPDTIEIGDDITFVREDETAVTHRVIGVTEDYEDTGERGFETQGVDNDAPDFELVRAANVVGVVKFHVPKVGQWLERLRGNLVITLCFTAGILLLAVLLKGAFQKAPENKNEAKKKKKNPRRPRRRLPAK